MQARNVNVGQHVNEGQHIGDVGTLYGPGGMSTGCHLHFGISANYNQIQHGGDYNTDIAASILHDQLVNSD